LTLPGTHRAGQVAAGSRDPIPHSRPALGDEEIAAVAAVVASGQLSQGPRVAELEAGLARFLRLGASGREGDHAVALSSGTAALYAALRALDVGAGSEVLIPAYTCASLHQAVHLAGATPRFVDCDPATLNPDPEDARRKLGEATAAIIVPHLFGLPADIDAFVELGPPVIEDCAQTLGVELGRRAVGSFGQLTVCSFYATKLLGAGEGGMVLSADRELVAKVAELRDCEDRRGNPEAFNFKMSDLHAAVGVIQLRRLEAFLSRRRQLAHRYREALAGFDLGLPAQPDDRGHAWFRFVVCLDGQDLDALLQRCARHGLVAARPVGRLVAAVEASFEELPGCRQAWGSACSVPLYPGLTDDEAGRVVDGFAAALGDGR
jgi:dTDP-4-amino-4,6-dideoxygalactose transaminase